MPKLCKYAIVNIKEGDCVLDPASGSGGFLLAAIKQYQEKHETHELEDITLIGFDKSRSMAKFARANLLLNGISKFNIIEEDFLSQDSKNTAFDSSQVDVVLCSLPINGHIYVSELSDELREALPNDSPKRIDRYILYIYKIIQILAEGGSAGVIVPEGFLSNHGHKIFRKDLIEKGLITAIVSLPENAFLPYSRIKTSILILHKKTNKIRKNPMLLVSLDNAFLKKSKNELGVINEVFKYYRDTGKALRIQEDFLDITILPSTDIDKNYRLDFSLYAPKYIKLLKNLKDHFPSYANLGEVAEIKSGRPFKRASDGDIRILTIANLKHGLNDETNYRFVSNRDGLGIWYVKPNDILISNFGNEFVAAIVPPDLQRIAIDEKISSISITDDRVIPEYIFALIQHRIVQIQLDHLSVSRILRRIYPKTLSQIIIPIVPLEDQISISKKIRSALDFEALADREKRRAKSMLQDLLRGGEYHDS